MSEPETQPCENCEGGGQCECPNCYTEHDCGECGGTGKVKADGTPTDGV